MMEKRQRVRFVARLVLTAVLVAGAAPASAKSVKAREGIEAANREFMSAFARQDAAAVAALYAEGAMMLPPGSDFVSGAEAIEAFWQTFMSLGTSGVELATEEVEVAGRTAREIGRFKVYNPDGHKLDEGKYLVVWVNEKGQWKLYRDIWNSNAPGGDE